MRWSRYELSLSERTHVMGVLNVTPDSFSDGGLFFDRNQAVQHGIDMERDGADIIDVGGESTRPYAERVSVQEEMERVIPVIEALGKEVKVPISIDTMKAEVAGEALKAGASMINDTTALRHDPAMASLAAGGGVPVILMHMKGLPENMQDSPAYDDVVGEIGEFLKDALERAVRAGIRKDMVILDPGIGFGKTFDHNLEIIKDLRRLCSLGSPILIGTSRKGFIGGILGNKAPERDTGSMAALAAGVLNGARIVRVHNVKMAVETVKVIDAVKRGRVSIEH